MLGIGGIIVVLSLVLGLCVCWYRHTNLDSHRKYRQTLRELRREARRELTEFDSDALTKKWKLTRVAWDIVVEVKLSFPNVTRTRANFLAISDCLRKACRVREYPITESDLLDMALFVMLPSKAELRFLARMTSSDACARFRMREEFVMGSVPKVGWFRYLMGSEWIDIARDTKVWTREQINA